MMGSMRYLCLALAWASCPLALAEGGSEGGNGGGGEIEFVSIRAEISEWIDARLLDGTLSRKLGLAAVGLEAGSFHALYERYEKTPVVFQDAPIVLTGYSTAPAGRICGNDANPARIACNNANWALASAQIKYAIVLHEILGVAGVESNQGEYSQYPISRSILGYIGRSEKSEIGTARRLAVELRERFASAEPPSKEQLQGMRFRCTRYMATLDAFPAGEEKTSAGEFELLQSTENSSDLVVFDEEGTRLDGMRISRPGFLSSPGRSDWHGGKPTEMEGMWVYQSLRFEPSSGKFLVELSVRNPELQYGIPYLRTLAGPADYNIRVWTYGVCEATPGRSGRTEYSPWPSPSASPWPSPSASPWPSPSVSPWPSPSASPWPSPSASPWPSPSASPWPSPSASPWPSPSASPWPSPSVSPWPSPSYSATR
jgi:hypothetical protein